MPLDTLVLRGKIMPTVTLSDRQLNVSYVRQFLPENKANNLYTDLFANVNFESLTFNFGGRNFTPSRQVAAFAEPGLRYEFSKTTVTPNPWTSNLLKVKEEIESYTGFKFNYAHLNYYPNGHAKISDHQDIESCLDEGTPIVCLSLGATRNIVFTRKDFASHSIDLENGSLLLMHAPSNQFWKHGIPAQPYVSGGRISLTFRSISTQQPGEKRSGPANDPDPKRRKFVPIQDDSTNELLLQKDIGIAAQVKVFHTRLGVYVALCPMNTGYNFDYSIAVWMNPTLWMEFANKFKDFNFAYKDSAFMCSNQVIVCAKFDNECIIQQLTHALVGLQGKKCCIELNRDDVTEFKEILSEVSDFVLDTMFSTSLEKLIHACTEKAEGIPPLNSKNEEVFWACITQAIEDCVHKAYKCYGCKIDHPSQWEHDCLTLSANEKYGMTGKKSLLSLNINKLANEICKSVFIQNLPKDFLKDITLHECITMFEKKIVKCE